MNELDDKGALFIADSLKELRTSMTSLLSNIPEESPLVLICKSIREACRYYMNTTPTDAGTEELEYSLGAVRKVVGINIKRIAETYGVQPDSKLSGLVPN